MSFAPLGNEGTSRPLAEINTTPLVDVMLVLLVIFIITAPLFRPALPIDLPRTQGSRQLEEQPLQVSIDAAGRVFLAQSPVERDDLAAHFRTAAEKSGAATELQLYADRATAYERVAEVMAAAQQAGIVKIAFVTDVKTARGGADGQ